MTEEEFRARVKAVGAAGRITTQTAIEVKKALGFDIFDLVDDPPDDEECVVICTHGSNPSPFDDNVYEDCADCGVQIMHRPHTPKNAIMVCPDCGIKRMREAEEE